jgi:hypothetical protein
MAINCTLPAVSRGHSLRREIAWALLFKMLALAVLYVAFFGPGHRVQVTAAQVSALFGQPGQTQGKH